MRKATRVETKENGAFDEENEENEGNEYIFKILVIGEANVGKTCIIKRFVDGTYTAEYKVTIGVDFAMKEVHQESKSKIILHIWDIAGQEKIFCYGKSLLQRC